MFRKRVFCLFSALVSGLLGCQSDAPRQPASDPTAPAAAIGLPAPASSSDQPRNPPATIPAADTSFLATWQQFDRALRQRDSVAFQELIDPTHGLWILEQPGAMPLLTRVERASAFRREYQQLPLFSLAAQLMPPATPTAVAQFPRFDCGAQGTGRSGFAREGCFVGPGTEFRALDVWPYATIRGGTQTQGQTTQQRVMRTVLQTTTGFWFHFGRSAAGRWQLLFLDLRVPCSA